MKTPEQQMKEEVTLTCEGCEKEEADTRHELVEKGWNWKEGSVSGLFNIVAAECPECEDVDIQAKFQQYREEVEEVHSKSDGDSERSEEEQTKLHNVGGGTK